MGEGNPALVFYISTESLPSNKDVLSSPGPAGTSCSFPVLKTRKAAWTMRAGDSGHVTFWPALSVWPQVPSESSVYSICDIWMNWNDCAIWIRINAGTIGGSFWTITWNKRQRWKCFLLRLYKVPQNSPRIETKNLLSVEGFCLLFFHVKLLLLIYLKLTVCYRLVID